MRICFIHCVGLLWFEGKKKHNDGHRNWKDVANLDKGRDLYAVHLRQSPTMTFTEKERN